MNEGAEKKTRGRKIPANVKLAVGIVVSLVFLYFAARNVDFGKIPDTLARVDYGLYSLSLVLLFASYFIKAMQVRIMLSFRTKVRSLPLVPPVIIGYYSNNIFPLKAGEIVRTSLIAKKKSLPFWAVFSAMMLERSLDLVFVLLVALIASFLISFPPEVLISIRGFVIFLILVFASFVALAVAAKKGGRVPRFVTRVLPERAGEYIRTTITSLAEGLWAVKKPLPLLGTLGTGLVFWTVNMTGYWLRLEAFGLPSSPAVVGFLVVVVGLGVSIPSAPSYVGVFHWLVVFALGAFDVGKDEAFSFALFSHGVDFVLVAILGNVSIFIEGLSFKALRRSAETRPGGSEAMGKT